MEKYFLLLVQQMGVETQNGGTHLLSLILSGELGKPMWSRIMNVAG
jgi:hypothetical protein